MRQITVKYDGECARCGTALEVGQAAMYEKSMGIFCPGHEPVEVEDIRSFRLAKAERKAAKYDRWAHKREVTAEAALNSYPSIRHDIAFNTQPGHIPFRSRMIKADERAFESLNKAKEMRSKAASLRHVQVAGDAERRRQARREAVDSLISKGDKVIDGVFGLGEIISIHKKSYRIKFNSGFTCARDKSFIRPI